MQYRLELSIGDLMHRFHYVTKTRLTIPGGHRGITVGSECRLIKVRAHVGNSSPRQSMQHVHPHLPASSTSLSALCNAVHATGRQRHTSNQDMQD